MLQNNGELLSDKQKTVFFIFCLFVPLGFIMWFLVGFINDYYMFKNKNGEK